MECNGLEFKGLPVRKVMYLYVTQHGGTEKYLNTCSSWPYCWQQDLNGISGTTCVYSDHPKSAKDCSLVTCGLITSNLMKSHTNTQLQWELNTVMTPINEWFQDNLITLNLNKTYLIHD